MPRLMFDEMYKIKCLKSSWFVTTILDKVSTDFSPLSQISFHHKWKGTKLLSPEREWKSCLTSCWVTRLEIMKFQENPEMLGVEGECPAVHQKDRFRELYHKSAKNQLQDTP